LTPDLIRTWKLGFSHRIDEIDVEIKKSRESDMEQDTATDVEEGKQIEKNT
jgi:hypothetical protein